MAIEIERKFLVSCNAWRGRVERIIAIRQFYLAVSANRSVRLRISDNERARLTLKFGSNTFAREEFEYDIPLADAEEMLPQALGQIVEKTRYHVRHGGYIYEVDEFSGRLEGLIVVELQTADAVAADQLPAWIGREVTGDQRYSNAMLALSEITPVTIEALSGAA